MNNSKPATGNNNNRLRYSQVKSRSIENETNSPSSNDYNSNDGYSKDGCSKDGYSKERSSAVKANLYELLSAGKIREIDRSFALFVHERLNSIGSCVQSAILQSSNLQSSNSQISGSKSELSSEDTLLLVMLSAITSEQLSRQHVCLELQDLGDVDSSVQGAGRHYDNGQPQYLPLQERQLQERQPFLPIFRFPNLADYRSLLNSDVFLKLGVLVFDGERLYLQRYWQYEQQVVAKLHGLAGPQFAPSDIKACLSQLYPQELMTQEVAGQEETGQEETGQEEIGQEEPGQEQTTQEPDWQKNAIALACLKSITVIAGGPGTGKTTTVVRILWILSRLYQLKGNPGAIIKMVAPTGKAAARLSEAVANAAENLPDPEANIPKQCSTIHRLLGVIPNSVYFRHSTQYPLNIDVLVVDEASMIDLPLLAKLLAALPQHCRVIMLGDSHQLASVEVGSVFSDICSLKQGVNGFSEKLRETLAQLSQQEGCWPMDNVYSENAMVPGTGSGNGTPTDFTDNIIFLTKSWRFHADSGIGRLASCVNKGNASETLQVLKSNSPDLQWYPEFQESQLLQQVLPHYAALQQALDNEEIETAFKYLSQLQILTAQRKGRWGLEHLNILVKRALLRQSVIKSDDEFYSGRPIMITSNDYQNRLFNGDIGLVVRHVAASNEIGRDVLKVWFQDHNQGLRSLLPAQLPAHETMYAITTHKSQGSEFNRVIFCLPEGQISRGSELLNRELLYTGITRAKKEFLLFADHYSVTKAVSRMCKRASGLASTLSNDYK